MKIYDGVNPEEKEKKRERESYPYGENLSLMKRAIAKAKY